MSAFRASYPVAWEEVRPRLESSARRRGVRVSNDHVPQDQGMKRLPGDDDE